MVQEEDLSPEFLVFGDVDFSPKEYEALLLGPFLVPECLPGVGLQCFHRLQYQFIQIFALLIFLNSLAHSLNREHLLSNAQSGTSSASTGSVVDSSLLTRGPRHAGQARWFPDVATV